MTTTRKPHFSNRRRPPQPFDMYEHEKRWCRQCGRSSGLLLSLVTFTWLVTQLEVSILGLYFILRAYRDYKPTTCTILSDEGYHRWQVKVEASGRETEIQGLGIANSDAWMKAIPGSDAACLERSKSAEQSPRRMECKGEGNCKMVNLAKTKPTPCFPTYNCLEHRKSKGTVIWDLDRPWAKHRNLLLLSAFGLAIYVIAWKRLPPGTPIRGGLLTHALFALLGNILTTIYFFMCRLSPYGTLPVILSVVGIYAQAVFTLVVWNYQAGPSLNSKKPVSKHLPASKPAGAKKSN